ncbi:hypothetical protein FSP39_004392 [Pinctada imbricata]|uniref:Tetratricopeptide repeat protein 29 n=1 Tax=Pinctada imbricata TaxID=66713 RepID=A0AA89C8E1_PINIB|nr:hypothetical protein FSP39_004392 [Pinctada imbricata]
MASYSGSISSYRNSYKHNLCLDMLQDGYHKSFSELFALIQQQEEERLRQGPESLMWTQKMLKDRHQELDMLKFHLTKAEEALRKDDYSEVYHNRYELARYFQSTGDKWLSDHFFNTCLQTTDLVTGDEGKLRAQGHDNVGSALEENGDYIAAAEHYEAYYKLAVDHKEWIQADGLTYHTEACINLSRIYTVIADKIVEEEAEKSLEYLKDAHRYANESGDRTLEGKTAYKLGQAYDKSGDGETALQYLKAYLDICNASKDSDGIGKACDAIAKAYARQGKLESSIDYLKKFVEVSESGGEEKGLSRACHNLGNIYNSLGKYEEATEYFSKAYNIARSMGDMESISTNRVQYGIAMAHRMMTGFGEHVVLGNRPSLERLIQWKDDRTDEFKKPFPEPKVEEPKPPSPVPAQTQEENPVPSNNNADEEEKPSSQQREATVEETETYESTSLAES